MVHDVRRPRRPPDAVGRVGVATHDGVHDLDDLLGRADRLMYERERIARELESLGISRRLSAVGA